MKQIYSVLTAIAVILTNALFAQSVTVSTTDPSPTPAFTIPLNVTSVNGFSTTSTGTFNEFPNNKTTTLVSPEYFYATSQTVVYFKYSFTIAAAGGPTNVAAPVATLTYGSTTITATASPLSISNGTADYYFTFNLGTTLPANVNFKIALTMSIIPGDRTVRANTLTTNAQLAGSGSPTPLPVKLVNFQGALNKNTVQLSWLIAENETAKSFEVQRSTNGTDFIAVAVIDGSKKSGDEVYSFTEGTSSARVLYRLKMYDVDSKAEYSRTLVFNASNGSSRSLQILTNPVKDKLVISFKNETSEVARINIYDNVGRVMQRQSLTVSQGINTNTISLNGNYRSGLYIVEVVTKAGKLSEKVIYSNQ